MSYTYKVGSPPLPIEFQKYYGYHVLCKVELKITYLSPVNAPSLGIMMLDQNVANLIVFTLSTEFLGKATARVD